MVYKKAKQRVRKIYSHGKSIFSGKFFKNSIMIGLAAGFAKNAISGKKIIDVEDIKTRISKMDGTNPLIFLLAGILTKNSALTSIGAFLIADPPDIKKNEELAGYSNVGEIEELSEYSNIRENQEPVEYSNIGETEEKEEKKKCIH